VGHASIYHGLGACPRAAAHAYFKDGEFESKNRSAWAPRHR
jgi:hypothetical protein